jgi:hypothetical protein
MKTGSNPYREPAMGAARKASTKTIDYVRKNPSVANKTVDALKWGPEDLLYLSPISLLFGSLGGISVATDQDEKDVINQHKLVNDNPYSNSLESSDMNFLQPKPRTQQIRIPYDIIKGESNPYEE